MNGGGDGTRTRGPCRDSETALGFTGTYRLRRPPKSLQNVPNFESCGSGVDRDFSGFCQPKINSSIQQTRQSSTPQWAYRVDSVGWQRGSDKRRTIHTQPHPFSLPDPRMSVHIPLCLESTSSSTWHNPLRSVGGPDAERCGARQCRVHISPPAERRKSDTEP